MGAPVLASYTPMAPTQVREPFHCDGIDDGGGCSRTKTARACACSAATAATITCRARRLGCDLRPAAAVAVRLASSTARGPARVPARAERLRGVVRGDHARLRGARRAGRGERLRGRADHAVAEDEAEGLDRRGGPLLDVAAQRIGVLFMATPDASTPFIHAPLAFEVIAR